MIVQENNRSTRRGTTPSKWSKKERPVLPSEIIKVPIIKSESDKLITEKNKEIYNTKSEIFEIIKSQIFDVESSMLELIKELNANEKYREYSQYFEIWIDDCISMKRDITRRVNKEREKGTSEEKILDKLLIAPKYRNYKKYIPVVMSYKIEDEEKGIEHE